jgi:predicted nucleic acid-binding protein
MQARRGLISFSQLTGYKKLKMKPIILDTDVLVAIFVAPEKNHHNAKELADYLIDENIQPRIPMHGYFQLACALRRKGIERTLEFQDAITEDRPIRINFVDIDQKFIERYDDPSLPYIKSGDFIFLAMARKDNAILITEDDKLYKKAVEAGIEVYKVKPFLEKFVDASN